MLTKVVFLPLRVGVRVTRITVGLSAKLAVHVAGEVLHVAQSQFGSSAATAASEPTAGPAPAADSAPAADPAAAANSAPAPVADLADDAVSPIEAFPDTPLTRGEADAKTMDDSDELVGEFAERGAEDGAGAQIMLDEPWPGYDAATAEAVTNELAGADAAELAVVELYELAHKARKTVLEAASRRLEELSPPDTA